MKKERLNYLISRYNILYINQLDGLYRNGRYKDYLGDNYVPAFVRKSNLTIKIFISFIVVFFPFLWLVLFLKCIYSLIRTQKIEYKDDSLFLMTSSALPKVVDRAGIVKTTGKWLPYPWRKSLVIPSNLQISVFNLLSFSDVLDSSIDYFRVFYFVFIKFGYKQTLLSLGAISWFLYNSAVKNVPLNVKLYFCNHYDQPVVLIDKQPHTNKILVQHGTAIITHNPLQLSYPNLIRLDNNFWVHNPPYRYGTVTEVFAFSEREETALKRAILKCSPIFNYTGYGLKLKNMGYKKKSILIVGYYDLYSESEEFIINSLQKVDVEIILKNHPSTPVSKYEGLLCKYNFTLINEPVFPHVDLVISYDSTLAFEYAEQGVQVLYYDDIDFKDVDAFLNQVNSYLG